MDGGTCSSGTTKPNVVEKYCFHSKEVEKNRDWMGAVVTERVTYTCSQIGVGFYPNIGKYLINVREQDSKGQRIYSFKETGGHLEVRKDVLAIRRVHCIPKRCAEMPVAKPYVYTFTS